VVEDLFKKVVAHAKGFGFIFQSSEIYDGGLQAVYDYGQVGVELKNNIKSAWYKSMVQMNENIVGLDAAIFMNPTVWKASGHVDSFNDPMIDNKDSKKRYRADVLLEDKAAIYKKEGDADRSQELLDKLGKFLGDENLQAVYDLIIEEEIVCPLSKTANWTDVRQFNLMFGTQVGSVAEDSTQIHLRPETAQGIFVNFLNVQKSGRMKIPFGIAQIGKAFRNEIVARQFIFRMREFEQMEMQFFVRPGTEMEFYEQWKATRMSWHKAMGLDTDKLTFHNHEKLAHYANAAVDIEYEYPFGIKEMEGIHSRTDFDLKAHQEFSKKKLQYRDEEIKESYVPYVVETSLGADRSLLAILCNAYKEETVGEGDKQKERTFLKFHPAIAPVKAAILPLSKKGGLAELGKEIFNELKFDHNIVYDDGGSIGKRYTRQDFIGTPFCITVDFESIEDKMVTVRHRDSMEQERVAISDLGAMITKAVSLKNIFKELV
jgi:glycyl-tRNA synthetase